MNQAFQVDVAGLTLGTVTLNYKPCCFTTSMGSSLKEAIIPDGILMEKTWRWLIGGIG